MTVMLIVGLAGAFLVGAALWHVMPLVRTGSTYFGVRVPAGFPDSHQGAAILRRFRLWNATLAAVATSAFVYFFLQQRLMTSAAILLAYNGAMLAALAASRNLVQPHHADAAPRIRTAALTGSAVIPSWFALFWIAPVLVFAVTAVLLAMNWAAVPAHFPAQWFAGNPHRLIERYAFALSHLSWLLSWCVLFYSACAVYWLGSRRSPADIEVLRSVLVTSGLIAAGVSVLFAVDTLRVIPWIAVHSKAFALVRLTVLVPMVLAVVFGYYRPRRPLPPDDQTSDDSWRLGGTMYVNEADPAWVVRSRVGYMLIPNWGHRWVRLGSAAMVPATLLLYGWVVFTWPQLPNP
jgi:uncharacterized membrane protein